MRPKIFKIAYFLAFFSVFSVFGNAIYSLLFHRLREALFALKISAFLPFFLLALLRYVRCWAAWRLSSCSTYPPPYTGGVEISLTPKKIFFIFFNIDIWRNFFYFFTFWHIVMVNRCLWCGVMFVILELRGILGVLWSFCILGDIIYRFDKQSVLKRLKIGFLR